MRIMRAVVVYESMYGNTHLIADAIGVGLSSAFDVRVLPVSQARPEVVADADLVVVGGPTHIHGMSRASTRKVAVQAADQPVGGLKVEPDALGPGLREWFGWLGRYPVRAAAFDTRMHGLPAAASPGTGDCLEGPARAAWRRPASHLGSGPGRRSRSAGSAGPPRPAIPRPERPATIAAVVAALASAWTMARPGHDLRTARRPDRTFHVLLPPDGQYQTYGTGTATVGGTG